MTKSFTIAMLLGASLFHLQGCGGGDATTTAAPATDAPTTTTTTTTTTVNPARVVKSSLRIGGVGSIEVAQAMGPSIKHGIAETMGAGLTADDVQNLEFTLNRRLAADRQLDAHAGTIDIDFEIIVPAGVDVATVTAGVTAAVASPALLIATLTAHVAANPAILSAVLAAGGDAAMLATLTVTVSAPSMDVPAADAGIADACTEAKCFGLPEDNSTRRLGAHLLATCSECVTMCIPAAGCNTPSIAAANAVACAGYAVCAEIAEPTGNTTANAGPVECEAAPADIAAKCTDTLCPNGFASVQTPECAPCAMACLGAVNCDQATEADLPHLATYVTCDVIAPPSARRLSFDLVI